MKQNSHAIPENDNYDIESNVKRNKKYNINCKKLICNVCIFTCCLIFIIIIITICNNSKIFIYESENTKTHEINYHYIWNHPFKNKPSLSELHSETYHWKKHYHPKCSDFDYGCCKIYDSNGKDYTLNLHSVIPYDKKHSNCPTYKDLINNYNIWRKNYYSKNNNTNCNIQKCCVLNVYQDELKKNKNITNNNISDYDIEIKYPIPVDTGPYGKRCPTTRDIVYEYNIDKYSDPQEFDIVWIILIIIIVFCFIFQGSLRGK